MLDQFQILSATGVVLWAREFTTVPEGLIRDFVSDVFVEQKISRITNSGNAESLSPAPSYTWNSYLVRWAIAKELGLVFTAIYQSRIHISWIDQLLANIRTLFTQKYQTQLSPSRLGSTTRFDCDFDKYFDLQIARLEPSLADNASALPSRSDTPLSSSVDSGTNVDSLSRPSSSTQELTGGLPNRLAPLPANTPAGRQSRRARKAATQVSQASKTEAAPKGKKGRGGAKQMRRWNDDGIAEDVDETLVLDYSNTKSAEPSLLPFREDSSEAANAESWGRRTAEGEFHVNDLEEMDSILASAKETKTTSTAPKGTFAAGFNAVEGLFRNFVGGKTLKREDMDKALKKLEDQLISKNVAREAAVRLCESIEQELLGCKTASFTSVEDTLRQAMEKALRKMLTPTNSTDLLREVNSVVNTNSSSTSLSDPYVISIVGVNGVGKSTNLSKLAYFFLQNHFRVLIVAADTFRSGAVEQLGVHVRNLKELVARDISSTSTAAVELYQKGYGTHAAQVAAEAVKYARQNDWQVVLIDTAGRRHNDARLMSNLDQFAVAAKPHKIFMVGEALVGSDAVQQARNFDDAFSRGPSSARGGGRHLDGFIISKCDTVGDMVGVLVSMVHATGIPVVFLGVGQHYSDLRTLSVSWAVDMLMKA